jgi:hypothetical protein
MTDAVLKALRAKALPSDVRKVPDLPILGSKYWGYAQFGAQPRGMTDIGSVGHGHHRTSNGKAVFKGTLRSQSDHPLSQTLMLLHQLQISGFFSAGLRQNDLNKLLFLDAGPPAEIRNQVQHRREIAQHC